MGYNFKKIAAMAIISMTVVSAITGCSQATDTDSAFQPLDVEQLESETTDINDRAEYYEKNVDDRGRERKVLCEFDGDVYRQRKLWRR